MTNPLSKHFFKIPTGVWLVALLASLLHMAPFWRAEMQTPPGWTFTGNLKTSPDYLQYRVWMRRSQETGVLVDNRFSSQPSKPYLPVAFYYFVGKLSRSIGQSPEVTYQYLGIILAFGLVLLLFVTVRLFLPASYQTWWVFLIILLGGGLGAHLKVLNQVSWVRENFLFRATMGEGLSARPPFEDYRGIYFFSALFDTHFLVIWLLSLGTVLSLYLVLRRPSVALGLLTVSLFSLVTILHIYEGITLLVVAASITALIWRKRFSPRVAVTVLAALAASGGTILMVLLYLHNAAGVPLPSWRAIPIAPVTLLLGFPLGWALLLPALSRYWKDAQLDQCFLLGWLLGCVVLTLSGPFYPYPDRGTMTLQIPLYAIAGALYFSRYARVTRLGAAVVVILLGATPALGLYREWRDASFNRAVPALFMGPEHQALVRVLQERSTENDILLVSKSKQPWETDDLWLGPEFPGRLYCGHFFLTHDYEAKRRMVAQFFDSTPERRREFLRSEGIRFLYVRAADSPKQFLKTPGLVLLKSNSVGALFEYREGDLTRPTRMASRHRSEQ
jgi:hypothetical protein